MTPLHTFQWRPQTGFTLVEMAMVLLIVGLLLGGLVPVISGQVEQKRTNETRKQLEEIKEALVGYAIINGRLPRPATSSVDGVERSAACTSSADCTGFIPWATLGATKLDSWGKIFRYSVVPTFAGDTTGTTSFTLTTSATKTIQTRDSIGALITQANSVPAVIFSYGKNNWGTDDYGNSIADSSTTNTDEDTNNSSNSNFISRVNSGSTTVTGGEFDDIVVWISPNVLANRMVTAGKLP